MPRILSHRGIAGFEPETLAAFLSILVECPTSRFLDVGANTGIYSLLSASLSDWETVAFEPAVDLAESIRTVADLNNLSIHVEQQALGDADGIATLYLSTASDSSHSLVPGFREPENAIDVRVETLDTWVDRTGRTPGLMKIDVETAEPAVIAGAMRTLERRRPWIICEVLGGYTETALMGLLDGLDYIWYQITPESPLVPRREIFGDRSGTFPNWLFAPQAPAEPFWHTFRRMQIEVSRCVPLSQGNRRALPVPAFARPEAPLELAPTWESLDGRAACTLEVMTERHLQVRSDMAADAKVYFTHGSSMLDQPPTDADDWALAPGARRDVTLELTNHAGEPDIQLWVIQYSGTSRLGHTNMVCTPGSNSLRIEGLPGVTSMRCALRISGKGTATVGPLEMFEMV